MNEFDPGEGWRETNERPLRGERVTYTDGVELVRAWVREEPVPPLPIEPYTVIRVTWIGGSEYGRTLTLVGEDEWLGGNRYTAVGLAKSITGFKVLAEPVSPDLAEVEQLLRQATDDLERVRRETAKTVIDRVRDLDGNELDATEVWDDLAREFGVLE